MLKMREVAERLRVSLSSAYSLAESGALPVVKVGPNGGSLRVLEEDLQSFIESRRRHKGDSPKAAFSEKTNPRKRIDLKNIRLD